MIPVLLAIGKSNIRKSNIVNISWLNFLMPGESKGVESTVVIAIVVFVVSGIAVAVAAVVKNSDVDHKCLIGICVCN